MTNEITEQSTPAEKEAFADACERYDMLDMAYMDNGEICDVIAEVATGGFGDDGNLKICILKSKQAKRCKDITHDYCRIFAKDIRRAKRIGVACKQY